MKFDLRCFLSYLSLVISHVRSSNALLHSIPASFIWAPARSRSILT